MNTERTSVRVDIVIMYNPVMLHLTYMSNGKAIGGLKGAIAERMFLKLLGGSNRIELTSGSLLPHYLR